MRLSIHPVVLLLAAFLLAPGGAIAQNVPVRVNGEPLTRSDLVQALDWQLHTDACVERVRTLLTGETYHHTDRQVRSGGPRTQEEVMQEAERIKKQIIADAYEEAVDNKLKLQAAKSLDITVSDAEVAETLSVCADPSPDGEPDMNGLNAELKKYGNNWPETVRAIARVQLAWRKVIRYQCNSRNRLRADPLDIPDESFSRSYLEELRQKAVIEY